MNTVWRRRLCTSCRRVFTTIEQPDYEKTWVVIGHSGSRAPFLHDKLLLSVHRSLQHRPTALPDALALMRTIVGGLTRMSDHGELTAVAIATITQQVLRRFDANAGTIYAAYHAAALKP